MFIPITTLKDKELKPSLNLTWQSLAISSIKPFSWLKFIHFLQVVFIADNIFSIHTDNYL